MGRDSKKADQQGATSGAASKGGWLSKSATRVGVAFVAVAAAVLVPVTGRAGAAGVPEATANATVSINPPSATFGYQRVGTYQIPAKVFTVTNSGPDPVSLSEVTTEGGNYYDFFGTTTCGDTLAANASCTVTTYFAPTRLGARKSSLVVFDNAPGGVQSASLSGTGTEGYYLAGAAGEIAAGGDAQSYGDLSNVKLSSPIVGITTTSNGGGYWLLGRDGGIFSFGNATFHGSTGGLRLNKPVIAMARTLDSKGYWLVASDGGMFTFGDARFFGSTGNVRLAKPIVGMAPTPDGNGYWLVASDGGIFSFGDAKFYGSTGAVHLNQPIVGMASTPSGKGYWLVASDGGIFSFGDASFYGSTGNVHLAKPIIGMAASPTGHGYWFVASDGGVFNFGDAPFYGSLGGQGVSDVVGIAATSPPLTPFYAAHAVSVSDSRRFGSSLPASPLTPSSRLG